MLWIPFSEKLVRNLSFMVCGGFVFLLDCFTVRLDSVPFPLSGNRVLVLANFSHARLPFSPACVCCHFSPLEWLFPACCSWRSVLPGFSPCCLLSILCSWHWLRRSAAPLNLSLPQCTFSGLPVLLGLVSYEHLKSPELFSQPERV